MLNAGLPGFTQREMALVGQAVRYHRKGMPSLGPFEPLGEKGDEGRLARIAALLRLAEDLERSRDQSVRSADVHLHNGSVRLDLQADEGVEVENGSVRLRLVGGGDDVSLARWAAQRETSLFERTFSKPLEVVESS